jgi:lysozyme family protein
MQNIFEIAFEKTMGHEGIYSNDPVDFGGETYRGISRKYNPEWAGWEILDDAKTGGKLIPTPHLNSTLNFLTQQYYQEIYWNNKRVNLDFVSVIFPDLSIEMFDIGVNMGTMRSGMFLQRALNILNRDEKIDEDMKVDGWLGPITLRMINKYIKTNDKKQLLKLVIILRAMHYINLVESNTTQERFIRGWLNRIELNIGDVYVS